VAEWHWECVHDDLLDGLPPDALRAVRELADELTVRELMVFLDGPAFTGDPPGLRTIQRGPLMLIYLTDFRGERVVLIQVTRSGDASEATLTRHTADRQLRSPDGRWPIVHSCRRPQLERRR
jgi:hypothetical protein